MKKQTLCVRQLQLDIWCQQTTCAPGFLHLKHCAKNLLEELACDLLLSVLLYLPYQQRVRLTACSWRLYCIEHRTFLADILAVNTIRHRYLLRYRRLNRTPVALWHAILGRDRRAALDIAAHHVWHLGAFYQALQHGDGALADAIAANAQLGEADTDLALYYATMGRVRHIALRLVARGLWHLGAFYQALQHGDGALANAIGANSPTGVIVLEREMIMAGIRRCQFDRGRRISRALASAILGASSAEHAERLAGRLLMRL